MGHRFETKIENVGNLIQLLLANPQGLRKAEIARRLGVHRSTAAEYLDELESIGVPVYEPSAELYAINREDYQIQVSLTMHESLALHLATRLLTTRTDKFNPHAASALRKLGDEMAPLAPLISAHMHRSADVMDSQYKRRDPVFLQVLETLTRAWSLGQNVRLTHEMENSEVFEYTFSPYYIEPYAVGRTLHVIGFREPPGKIRTFKIERIRTIELLPDQPYTIPDDFDPNISLQDAWGIWSSEEEPQLVRLRFSSDVARRVKETVWHESQQLIDQNDGCILWEGRIAEPREMLPWIRGWGADVEVLEPEWLREELEKETRQLMQLYQVPTLAKKPEQSLLRLWGKTGKNEMDFHPALYHMFDVGYVSLHLLKMPQSIWRGILARAFNTDADTLADWFPWLVALHDIGKISVPFQAQNFSQRARLEREGFSFGQWKPKDKIHHTDIGRIFLKYEFDETDLSPLQQSGLHEAWFEMIGGHHGTFAGLSGRTGSLSRINKHLKSFQVPDEWIQFRHQADQILRSFFLLKIPGQWPEPENISAAIMALTGFTILCDWLGSDERYFTPYSDMDISEYAPISCNQAKKAIEDAGFLHINRSEAPVAFSELFSDRIPPRPLQQSIDEIPDEILQQPCLAIIEAPTGEGKTEAALALAHRIAQYSGTDALYCALPTQATSNQMFQRLQKHLQQRLGLQVQVKLIHGQAFLVEDDLCIEPLGDVDNTQHPSLEWFSPGKRGLLAPFGVGTVDQAELSALNVRHNALRLIGLAGKVIILDEVHAYDTYMTTIIKRMLEWLSALGSTVILLSATLPSSRRSDLSEAYGISFEGETNSGKDYPSLWVGNRSCVFHVTPAAYKPHRVFSLKHLHIQHDDATKKAAWVLENVGVGGCGCWITNTVERAQKLYSALKLADPTLDISLLHARFPIEKRYKLESEITRRFGPEGDRPQRSFVIGTQVLEQSLDLDFDFMVTDLAPIDLLLQRMGRLHRHENLRPMGVQIPTLWVNSEPDPANENRVLMGADRFYHEYILQKTWQAIASKDVIMLPDEYRPLVETVYSPGAPEATDWIYPAWKELQNHEASAKNKARNYLLPNPNPRRAFCNGSQVTFEEDEDSSAWFVAQTRLGSKSVTVLALERDGEKARLYPLNEWVNLMSKPTRDTELRLLRRTFHVSQPDVVAYLQNQGNPKEPLFHYSSLLKSVYPLWLINGEEEILTKNKNLKIIMHPEQGLVIESK